MEIRELRRHEVLPALHLIWEVFIKDVAPSYMPEGIEEFQKTIKYETVLPMYMNKEITMFGAFEGAELIGTISVKNTGHIFMFFVKSACQGKGAGRLLFQAVRQHCVSKLLVSRITVNAAPDAVPKYIRMGMHPVMPVQTVKGMRYTPMEMAVNPCTDRMHTAPADHTDHVIKIILVSAAALAGVFVIVFLISAVTFFLLSGYRNRTEDFYRYDYYGRNYYDDYDDYYDNYYDYYGKYYGEGGKASEEEAGLDTIPEFIAGNLSYEIKDDNYSFTDFKSQNVYTEFFVQYPQIDGMEENIQEKINQIIEECAMKSVEEIYLRPSGEVKEAVIESSSPIIASYVQYKVCFASEDLLSIAFEDYSYRGSMEAYQENLRTLNINLRDGTVYQVKDVVDICDGFADLWLGKIREGAAGERAFSELNRNEIKRTLAGDSLGGVYVVNFFFDEDGINIGYDLNYDEDDPHDIGYVWLTAVFEKEELEEYVINREIWE